MKYEDLRAAVEAILFVAKEPVSRDQILAAMDGQLDESILDTMVTELEDLYRQPGRGLRVERVAGGLRISTRPETGTFIRSFLRENNVRRLSPAALEALAVVGYRQPITGPEIQDIRGTDPSGVLKTLLERRLVRITGKKQVAGRPLLYGTTKEFLMQFGLDSLEDLPDLHHFEEMFGQEAKQEWLFPPEGKAAPIALGDLDGELQENTDGEENLQESSDNTQEDQGSEDAEDQTSDSGQETDMDANTDPEQQLDQTTQVDSNREETESPTQESPVDQTETS